MTVCTPLLLAALIGAAAVPVKVFEEEFDRYPEQPAIFSENSHIDEGRGMKWMNFTPSVQETLLKTPYLIPDDPVNFDFLFDFKFSANSKREFAVQLFMKDPEKANAEPECADIKIAETGSGFKSLAGYRIMQWSLSDDGPLPGFIEYNYAYKARLEVREGYARLYIRRGGKWYLEAQGQMLKKGMILASFNIRSASQVILDSIQVWKYPADAKSPAFEKEFAFDGKEAEFEVADLPYPSQYQLRFIDEKENQAQLTFRTVPEKNYIRTSRKDGKTLMERYQILPDAGIMVSGPEKRRVEVRTRPNLYHYTLEGNDEMAAQWESFPAASKAPLHIRVKQTAPGVCELWINEKMAFPVKTEAALKKIAFRMPGGTVRTLAGRKFPEPKGFQVVDPASSLNWSKLWANPATNRLAKYAEVCGVPFLSAKEYSFPLSICEENKGSDGLEGDGYLTRTAFDAMPSSVHFSVPAAQYIKAYALCSVDPDATPDMVPEITARLTNFSLPYGGRGDGFCHHTVRLPAKPGDPLPPNVKIAGGTKEKPLYFVEFDLDAGSIEDIIFRLNNPSLDFEFLGRMNEKDNFYVNRAAKPSQTKSSVILHAATLKRTPAELRVDQGRTGALWYLNENPRMNVHVKPLEKGAWTVKTEIADEAGKVLTSLSEKVTEEKDLEVRFPQKEYGWYGVKTVLEDAKGTPLVTRRSSFVLLPPDTRKAGPESPYHAWVYECIYGAGNSGVKISEWGDFLLRMGTRLNEGGAKNEAEEAAWKLYKGQFAHLSGRTEEQFKKQIEDNIGSFPHTRAALVLHEMEDGPWPLELIGRKTEISPEQEASDKKMAETARIRAKAWREYAPHIRLITGNSGNALKVLAQLFRQKYPRELIDAMGDEYPALSMPPEFTGAVTAWSLAELARIYGYKDLQPDACYEWRIRGERLTPRRYTAYRMRDNLVALAWNYTLVNGTRAGHWNRAYYNTVWGSGGCFTRYPLWDPLPAAAALATQTLMLDCAKYSRLIPTGSDMVYVVEFRRENEYVYACWTARGETAADLTFEKPASVLRAEMCGKQHREKTSGSTLEIPVTEDPSYVTSSVPLKSAQVKNFRTFRNEPLPAGKPDLVCAMDDASAWETVSGVDPRIIIGGKEQKHLFAPAKFEIRTADDEVKGKTLELELAKDENRPVLVQETGFIRLKTPLEIPGKPHTLGVSCKGNSSWGKLMFEITDAEGEVFLSAGGGGHYCPTYDWEYSMGFNYDNWHTLAFPLTEASPVKIHSPGENQWQWQRSGGKFGNGKVDYPVKLTAIGFMMYRKTFVINQLKEAGRTFRLRDFVSWSDGK